MLVLAAAMLIAAPPASAAPAQGTSTIVTAPGLVASTSAAGVTMSAKAPGTASPAGRGPQASVTFRFPVASVSDGIVRSGGSLVLTNTGNGRVVELRDFQIDIPRKRVLLTVPQAGASPIPALVVLGNPRITVVKEGSRTRTRIIGARLAIAPGMAWQLNLLLGLWPTSGLFTDGQVLGTADLNALS